MSSKYFHSPERYVANSRGAVGEGMCKSTSPTTDVSMRIGASSFRGKDAVESEREGFGGGDVTGLTYDGLLRGQSRRPGGTLLSPEGESPYLPSPGLLRPLFK